MRAALTPLLGYDPSTHRSDRSVAFTALVKLFSEPQYFASKETDTSGTGQTEIDYEEQTAGYQAAYSQLAASESGPVDPVANVGDVTAFWVRALGGDGGAIADKVVLSAVDGLRGCL